MRESRSRWIILFPVIIAFVSQAAWAASGLASLKKKAAVPQREESECETYKDIKADLPDEELAEQAVFFGQCLYQYLYPQLVRLSAIEYFLQASDSPNPRLSSMSPDDLAQYMNATEQSANTRAKYDDADLSELATLARQVHEGFQGAQTQVIRYTKAHPNLFKRLQAVMVRYKALAELIDSKSKQEGARLLAMRYGKLFGLRALPKDYAYELLDPYGILGIVPSEGNEWMDIGFEQSPLMVPRGLAAGVVGPADRVARRIEEYRSARQSDNPAIPEHAPAHPQAAKVAFVDTGVDYVSSPELAEHLGRGKDGELAQMDFTDEDSNSFIPAEGILGHGTGTLGTLVTLAGELAPELLKERRLDLAMWKTGSIREMLSSSPPSAIPVINALVERITRKNVPQPKIVSLSVSFNWSYLISDERPRLLHEAPWLWVMAAGNDGVDIKSEENGTGYDGCFSGIANELKPRDRILCVGALKRDSKGEIRVARYSNMGDLIDVYAYESYDKRCPNGTSCSTPGVTAGAAIIAAKYPKLKPAQIRAVILAAAEMKTLKMEASENEDGFDAQVKVFDPKTQMARALEIAAKMAK